MGIYTLKKDKNGKEIGPWIVKYPHRRDNETDEVLYTTCRARTRREAKEIHREKMVEWQRKCRSGPEPKREYTFGELADWYLDQPDTRRRKSYKKIRHHCKTLEKEFGPLKADEVKPFMVEAYRAKKMSQISCRGTPYKPASVNREIEVMKRIFNLAFRNEMVARNPCWKVTRLAEKNARDRILSAEELEKLGKELPRHALDFVFVAYYTGMRPGEIFGLTWDRVNLEEGYLNLTQEDTKTGEARRIYFVGTPVEEIFQRLYKAHHLSHNHVFTYLGEPLKSIKVALKRALQKAGISDFRPYDLRHTFVTNARRAGIDRTIIMKLTGHKTLSMFTRYNKVDPAEGKEATERLMRYLGEKGKDCFGTASRNKKGAGGNR